MKKYMKGLFSVVFAVLIIAMFSGCSSRVQDSEYYSLRGESSIEGMPGSR